METSGDEWSKNNVCKLNMKAKNSVIQQQTQKILLRYYVNQVKNFLP